MYKPNQLTPEQQARQDLMIEALKEQARYERSLQRQLVKKVKMTVDFAYRVLTLGAVLGVYFVCYYIIAKMMTQ
jgi:hypothetical protein